MERCWRLKSRDERSSRPVRVASNSTRRNFSVYRGPSKHTSGCGKVMLSTSSQKVESASRRPSSSGSAVSKGLSRTSRSVRFSSPPMSGGSVEMRLLRTESLRSCRRSATVDGIVSRRLLSAMSSSSRTSFPTESGSRGTWFEVNDSFFSSLRDPMSSGSSVMSLSSSRSTFMVLNCIACTGTLVSFWFRRSISSEDDPYERDRR
mmetsp:Transcript_57689/g.137278  ORF Transcript_57689/g.137278 Transcript_57689/m.137278 type:complete len:205 (+) Transcript_57689:870-1484(+)